MEHKTIRKGNPTRVLKKVTMRAITKFPLTYWYLGLRTTIVILRTALNNRA
jgi:hypothetical protein